MTVLFSSRFTKDIDSISDRDLRRKIEKIVAELKRARSLAEVPNVKKMQGRPDAFRIRLGEYRVGLYLSNDKLTLHRFLHRKEIYRTFP